MNFSVLIKQAVLLLFFVFSGDVVATIDVYNFNDAKLEKRFKKLTYELRCPKCQNASLADSNSTLSQDLKQIIYEKLIAGENDQQVLAFMKQRYGEFILFKPEMSQSNAALWVGPFLFLLVFLWLFFKWYFNNREVNDE